MAAILQTKKIKLNFNVCIVTLMSQKFVSNGPKNNRPKLVENLA